MHAEEMAFFYELAANEQIRSCPTGNLNGTEIRPLLAGDST